MEYHKLHKYFPHTIIHTLLTSFFFLSKEFNAKLTNISLQINEELNYYIFKQKMGSRGITYCNTQIIYKGRKTNTKRGGLKPKPSGETNTSNKKIKREQTTYKQKEQHHTTD